MGALGREEAAVHPAESISATPSVREPRPLAIRTELDAPGLSPSLTFSADPFAYGDFGPRGHNPSSMFQLLSLMPTPGRLPSRDVLLSRAARTRAGGTTFDELVRRGHSTCGLRIARNTIYAKRVALGWLSKFVAAMNLPTEIMDPHVMGADSVTDQLLAGMEYMADCVGAKNETGLALGATVATYAVVWIDAHQLLPTPIDLTWLKPKVKAWKEGRIRNMTGAFGIIKKLRKAGVTRSMMQGLYDLGLVTWLAACSGDAFLVIVVKAAGQLAFVMMLRRSEYTLVKGISEFNPMLRMTRSNAVWFDADGIEFKPDEDGNLRQEDFEELFRILNDPTTNPATFFGRMDMTVKTSKADQTGDWSSHVHPIALRLPSESAVLKAANYYLEYELADPVLNLEERQETPLFRSRRGKTQTPSRGQLKVDVFNEAIIDLLHELFKIKGDHRSKAEIRKLYSLHSFRIGGVNHLRAAGVPREIRMILGRWRSDAIDVYSRTDISQFTEYLKDHGVSCDEFETLADDMPCHEDSFGTPYGRSFNVITENDKPLDKLVPEISAREAAVELNSLRQVNANDEPLKRQHSLIGRAIESYFDSATYGGLQTAAVGTVVAVHLARKETPCEVMYMGATEPEYLSIQEVVDSLVAGGSEFEQEDI